jgi:hypothetical protein
MAPQSHLQEAGLDPRGVHLLDVLGGVPLLSEKRFEGERYGEDQQEQVAKGHDIGRRRAVGAVLFRTVVTEADLVLVIEPLLVVFGAGSVEYPLPEALANCTQVVTERLAVAFASERREQGKYRGLNKYCGYLNGYATESQN